VDRHASSGRASGEARKGGRGPSGRVLCGVLLTTLAVVGCGGDNDGGGTGPTPPAPLAFERSFLRGGFVGMAYATSFAAATGGTGPVSYSLGEGALPPGLNLSGRSITGVPTEPGMHWFEVVATAGDETESVVFALTISNNGPAGFNLFALNGADEIPQPRIRTAIDDALERWESIVTGNLGPRTVPASWFGPSASGGECVEGELLNGRTLEDIYLFVDIGVIDGTGGGDAVNTLGRAGPCLGFGPQGGPILTSVAQMVLDSEDLTALSDTRLAALVWHEIGHGVGLGTWWSNNGHLQGAGTENPLYEGADALSEYNALLGGGGAAAGVPVEGSLGEGSDGTHWDEATFNAEIMTAISEIGPQPISRMTLASLQDGGYQVALEEADPYELPACSPDCPEPAPAEPGSPRAVDVVLPPPGYVTPDGRVIRLPRRAP